MGSGRRFEEFIRRIRLISSPFTTTCISSSTIRLWKQRGDFSLRWDAAGDTILERGGTRGETVRCDIQTLTAMFYGYKRPTYLKRVERLQANDTAVRILEDIIPIEQPYFSDYF